MDQPIPPFTAEQWQDAQRLIARSWVDAAFKAALLADPMGTLAAEGFALPEGISVKFHANTPGTVHVVLPDPPSAVLSDDDLANAAGGIFTFPATVFQSLGPMSAGSNATGGNMSTPSPGCAISSITDIPPPSVSQLSAFT